MQTSNNDLIYFLSFLKYDKDMNQKLMGVLNHNLKLQCKKLSRTRDIPNFPTQGSADTAFYTRNWSETYLIYKNPFLRTCKKKSVYKYIHSAIHQDTGGQNSLLRAF